MKPAFVAVLATIALGCAAVPPSVSPERNPSDPRAPEAPPMPPSKALFSDPPPPEALEDSSDAGRTQPQEAHQHGSMGTPDGSMGSGGMEHHHGAMDGGMR